MDNPDKLATQGTQDTLMKTGNIGYTRYIDHNPDKLATQGTQDTLMKTGNIGYTRYIDEDWQHWVHKIY